MSIALIPEADLVSEDWQLAEKDTPRPIALVVQLRRQAYVLPYMRFVCADGDNSNVRIVFASHQVIVTGHNLAALLAALAAQIVVRIIQPTDNEATFGVRGADFAKPTGPTITDITVEEFR
jgi:hypothetical protein